MSALPILLRGELVRALVVGGGAVAERKVGALLDAGAHVRVVSPAVTGALAALADAGHLALALRAYEVGDVGDAVLVFAATDRRDVNARVAADARALGRLVNVADAPDDGDFATPAVHRARDLVVAVGGGRVPAAAARVRDAVAARFGVDYGDAVAALAALRGELLADGRTAEWRRASAELAGGDFCERVEAGGYAARVASWR